LQDTVFLDVLPIDGDQSEYIMRLDYITNSLGLNLIGQGHFRHVFETGNPDILLKVATDRWTPGPNGGTLSAVQANLQEVGRFNRYPKFFPKSYAYDEDGVWILVERIHKVYATTDEFTKGIVKSFKPINDFDQNILNAILMYSYQMFQNLSPHVTEEELQAFSFEKYMNDVTNKIMNDVSGFGVYKDPAFPLHAKKDIFFDILRSGIEKGESYENVVESEVKEYVKWMFDELKIHWISAYLRSSTESDPEYGYFKFANSVLDKRMLPLIIRHVEASFFSDKKTRDFFLMMQREKISLFDLRHENTGETKPTKGNAGDFKIIDATRF
jgi:hypothetical protein